MIVHYKPHVRTQTTREDDHKLTLVEEGYSLKVTRVLLIRGVYKESLERIVLPSFSL